MLPSIYAKLFSRIAQSSLMEEDIETRYCFMMLLAIADSGGDVIGTDIAIARTVNLPLETFKRCIAALMAEDPDSNSQIHDGRRLVLSESGRGYLIVNYVTYRQIKTAEEKKAYMREYMARYRKELKGKDVTDVKKCKNVLSEVTHAEGEGEGETKAEAFIPNDSPPGFDEFWKEYPKKVGKGAAEQKWLQMKCNRIFAQVLNAVKAAKKSPQWTKDGGQFVPNPATWLHQKRWEDELFQSAEKPKPAFDLATWHAFMDSITDADDSLGTARKFRNTPDAAPPPLKDRFATWKRERKTA